MLNGCRISRIRLRSLLSLARRSNGDRRAERQRQIESLPIARRREISKMVLPHLAENVMRSSKELLNRIRHR